MLYTYGINYPSCRVNFTPSPTWTRLLNDFFSWLDPLSNWQVMCYFAVQIWHMRAYQICWNVRTQWCCPSFIYSWSKATFWNMNFYAWAIWAAQGSNEEEKLSITEQPLRVGFFSTFCWHIILYILHIVTKKLLTISFKNSLAQNRLQLKL